MEIGEPTLLAKLPRTGPSEEGSRKFSQVYGVRDGKTKKRNEVCAAIDGNSLNIFEVVNGRNIASWPVPPDAVFTSLPYSERKFVDNTTFVRRCWCAMRRKGHTTIHYYEHVKAGSSTRSETSSYPLETSGSPVIKIEYVSTSERQIVVTQDDGNITCLSSAGGVDCHRYQLCSSYGRPKVHAVQSMSLADARVTTLKGRPDISATLTDDSVIVSAVYSNIQNSLTVPNGLFFGVWILPKSTAMAPHGSLDPAIVFDLQTNTAAVPFFKFNGSKLEIRSGMTTKVFDVTTAAPQKLYERRPFSSDQTSNIELSQHLNLSFSSGELRLYNPDFNSLLASARVISASLKRKRDGLGLSRLSFIAYFSQLKRVVAFSGSQLLAIDVHVKDATQDPFKQSSLLIGNILKGRGLQMVTPHIPADASHDQPLSSLAQELDELIRSQDTLGFERALTESFNLKQWENLKKLNFVQKKFIIEQLFAVTTEEHESKPGLALRVFPTQLLCWCIKSGMLDNDAISKMLSSDIDLPLSAISDCFLKAGDQLHLLQEYTMNAPYIEPAALTRTIKSLIDEALQVPEVRTAQRMAAGALGSTDEGFTQQQSSQTSSGALTSRSNATTCLVCALERLALAGSATVSEQIRTLFEQKEILAVIQFLRQQLFLGGHTRLSEGRNYPGPPPSQVDAEDIFLSARPEVTLNGIVTLLNGCIDSLGVVGVIGSNQDQAFIERMIPELCSEIESATAAVEDSTYLQGLLRETLRYAESVERQPFEIRNRVERSNNIASKKGKITTLYAEGDAVDMGVQLPTVLPLSLRAEEDLSKRKIRRGGQRQARSVREMGMLKDRLKAPYAFERLIL